MTLFQTMLAGVLRNQLGLTEFAESGEGSLPSASPSAEKLAVKPQVGRGEGADTASPLPVEEEWYGPMTNTLRALGEGRVELGTCDYEDDFWCCDRKAKVLFFDDGSLDPKEYCQIHWEELMRRRK